MAIVLQVSLQTLLVIKYGLCWLVTRRGPSFNATGSVLLVVPP